jgi:hypothetical protein
MDQVTKRYFALLNEVFCAMRMTGCVRGTEEKFTSIMGSVGANCS